MQMRTWSLKRSHMAAIQSSALSHDRHSSPRQKEPKTSASWSPLYPILLHLLEKSEIGLGGELRMIPRIERRGQSLAKLEYKKCVVLELAKKALSAVSSTDIQIVGCKNLKQVIDKVFRKQD